MERFMAKIAKQPSGCWLWTGSKLRVGYGKFCMNGIPGTAHRAAWELFNGPIPEGMYVCHACDVRACVNPDHLFLGSQSDNMLDASSKNRLNTPKGSDHHSSKLTEEDVLAIRSRYTGRRGEQRRLADEYGVGPDQISRIINGKRWRWLTEEGVQ